MSTSKREQCRQIRAECLILKKLIMTRPNQKEKRIDTHYAALRITFNGKHFFKLTFNPTVVLNIGTGTGIWALDIANRSASARALVIDLSPIQLIYIHLNLEFSIHNTDDD
jgi:tRNA G46 methylase TrmB